MNNLPDRERVDSNDVRISSGEEVRQFFDKFFRHQITFPTNQIDSVMGFFLKRGFGEEAARSTSIVLLNQARLDSVNVFQLIDQLKGLTDVQLSRVVAEVLNAYRIQTSTLGYKVATLEDTFENRNILV
jgi:hypothetical protein